MKICATTILYNPPANFIENIATYFQLVDHLFIVDNSTNSTSNFEKLIKKFGEESITFLHFEHNIGIAAALNESCQLAFRQGFGWILTMDQDSYFEGDAFFKLANPLFYNNEIAIMAASFTIIMPFLSTFSPNFWESYMVITSGSLVNLSAWNVIRFNEDLFIDEVDNYFCLMAKKAGYKILTSREILLKHQLGDFVVLKIPGIKKQFRVGFHSSPIRNYYVTRNSLFIIKASMSLYPSVAINRIKNLFMRFIFILFFYPQKRNCLKYVFRGVVDFSVGRYGKY